MNTRRITLDVSKYPGSSQIVRIGRNDVDGVVVEATITDHGEPLSLSSVDATLLFRINGQLHEIVGTTSGNVATFTVDTTSTRGMTGNAYVSLEGDGFKLSTSRFAVEILEGV